MGPSGARGGAALEDYAGMHCGCECKVMLWVSCWWVVVLGIDLNAKCEWEKKLRFLRANGVNLRANFGKESDMM